MKLSDAKIRAAKPAAKIFKLSDGHGLQLWIRPSGAKTWRRAYRFDGRQRDIVLGQYPAVSLAEARAANLDIDRVLAAGREPNAERREQRVEKAVNQKNTFQAVADDMCRRSRWADQTRAKNEYLLRVACADLGQRPIRDIRAPEILATARKMEDRGRASSAVRLISLIGQLFRHGVREGFVDGDPTPALKGAIKPPKVKRRAAVLKRRDFGGMMRAIASYEGQAVTRIALELLAHTFVRPGELRLARWEEFDLDEAEWTIPAGRMKMREPHAVPLSRQALKLLKELRPLTGRSALVLPGVRLPTVPLSENTLNAALRRLGYSKDEATSHGFRASASTLIRESGKWNPEAVEAALAHRKKNDAEAAYARGKFWNDRRRMMQWWSDEIDAMREGGEVKRLRA